MWWALWWGAFGGFLVAGADFLIVVGRIGTFPWRGGEPKVVLSAYLAAAVVRVALGGGLALAAASSGIVKTPLLAIAIGVGAPLTAEKLTAVAQALLEGRRP
ncbi:MAG: hypothetical protein ACRDTH_24460 [Pseudonocardiaceae bacterium]